MGKFPDKKQFFSFITLFFFLFTLPFLVIFVHRAQQYLLRAQGVPANIFIDTQEVLGPMPRPWKGLAQGGEEEKRMLKPVISQLREISPNYIRIDHVLNHYQVVSRQRDESLTFNFSILDQTVDDIISCGAIPFFSLSYIPEALSTDGSPTSPPKKWEEWSLAVEKVVEHYTGKEGRGLSNIYYEVFNEPDLFGGWKISGEPNYLTLYYYAVLGAQRAKNTNQFFIGGPATTVPYQNWIREFLRYVSDNNLRVDFISWHRYSSSPNLFLDDVSLVDSILSSFPQFANLPKIITEFGFDSENNSAHDTNLSATHLLAVMREILGKVDLAFTFEAKDGPNPQGEEYWGRWGILTYNGRKKPRFLALSLLNKIGRHQLKVWGEGSWVKAIASREFNKIGLLLVNFDLRESHSEAVPINFLNLEKGVYTLTQERLSGETFTTSEAISQGVLKKEIFLPPNEIVLLELEKVAL